MLASHKISGFDAAMRSSMNISIAFRTKYEGNLDRISRNLSRTISDQNETILRISTITDNLAMFYYA